MNYRKRYMGLPVALAAAVWIASGAPQHASAQSWTPAVPTSPVEFCRVMWDNSSAHDHCTIRNLRYDLSSNEAGTIGNCVVEASCSIEVTQGGRSTTYSGEFQSAQSSAGTSQLDLCFARDRQGEDGYTYSLHMRYRCADGEIDSATATEEGLPAR